MNTARREKLQLTKADLKRRDVPLFDCLFCVENAGLVMKGMLQKSLVTEYLEQCRYIAGNEQIPIQLERKAGKPLTTKYDPDQIESWIATRIDGKVL